jgi:hypothetical protein
MKITDLMTKFSKIKTNQVRSYATVYKLEDGFALYTDGFGILKVKLDDVPEDRKGKVYRPNGLESQVQFPNVAPILTAEFKKTRIDEILLNETLKYIKAGSKLALNEDGINLNEGIGLNTLCSLWGLVKGCKALEVKRSEAGIYQITCTEGVTIYVAEWKRQDSKAA